MKIGLWRCGASCGRPPPLLLPELLGSWWRVRAFLSHRRREGGSKTQPRKERVSEGGLWSLDVGGGAVINFPLMAT